MEVSLKVFSKEYKCYVVEQPGRAKGTRFKAYGNFDNNPIEATSSSIQSAMKRLREKAKIVLDY